MKAKLNATQLKIIAIIAMVIDHTAWGFVDMFSPLGQIMHTIGRLTIPIMCFFIAEGFRKTHDLRRYLERMFLFSMITVIPFALFFGEEYGYRQNFFFDLTLALIALTITEHPTYSKVKKIVYFTVIVLISAVIGGWPILPIMLVQIFYYVKSFKKQCLLVVGSITLVEATLIPLILLNHVYQFAPRYIDWRWYEYLYFFGFVLALPLLKMYSGERGRYPIGRYFFFCFYPAHFLVLYAIKQQLAHNSYSVYFTLHVLCLFLTMALAIRILLSRPSRAQIAASLLAASGTVYIFGFILEILTNSVEIAFAGTVVEYFGECVVYLSFFWFITELCHYKVRRSFYIITGSLSVLIMYLLITTPTNHIFYTEMSIDESGAFHRLVLEYGPGFYVFFMYIAILTVSSIYLSFKSFRASFGIDRKRILYVIFGMISPWIAFAIRYTGITDGHEISAVGVLGSVLFIYIAMIRYGFFDSLQLAGENALHHVEEGIIVIGTMNQVLYINTKMEQLFPELHNIDNASKSGLLIDMLSGKITETEINDRYYEISVVPLIEKEVVQGQMLCVRDITEQHQILAQTEYYAHTDSLTGLLNRAFFKTSFARLQENPTPGYVLMVDLDNFKKVNDENGHGVGDEVLIAVADTFREFLRENDLFCRVGGDEFGAFIGKVTEEEEIITIGERLIQSFAKRLVEKKLPCDTSISVGAAYYDAILKEGETPQEKLSATYHLSDHALYEAKNSGKGIVKVYHQAEG